ncbi:MAG: tRNA-queuosine alpha-mannosyltransferase domain-containing protein [Wenzhouxiangella sp.]
MPSTIWLLSAYRADSHAYWADWLIQRLDEFSWQRRELPGRHFAWRMRGNPLSWLHTLPDETPALILATSMVDLATIKGLHPRLAQVPCAYYFHENQFAYPRGNQQHSSVDTQMVQLYGALAADYLLFNSRFNRDSFLAGVERLLTALPDQQPPIEALIRRLRNQASLLPVPVEPIAPTAAREPGLITWNHRWEYDKQPELFAEALVHLAELGLDFTLALLGPRGRRPHPALEQLRHTLGDRIVVDGFLERDDYRRWLSKTALVVSTASHEFQGIALLEAVSAGARPVVPDALCYPEQYPAHCRYPAGDAEALTHHLATVLGKAQSQPDTLIDLQPWLADQLEPAWKQRLQAMAG